MVDTQRQAVLLDTRSMAADMAGMFKAVVVGDTAKFVGKVLSSAGNSAHSGPAVFISGATGPPMLPFVCKSIRPYMPTGVGMGIFSNS